MESEVRGIATHYSRFKRLDSSALWVKIHYDNDSVDCPSTKANQKSHPPPLSVPGDISETFEIDIGYWSDRNSPNS